MPKYFRIERWLGQVGSETKTLRAGLANLPNSKACRTAPVPPGVAAEAIKFLSNLSPKRRLIIASENSGVPVKPTYDFVYWVSHNICSAFLIESIIGVCPEASL